MKAFITVLIILLLLRLILKPILKFTVSTTINKMANEAMKQQQEQFNQRKQKSEGTISVDYIPAKDKPARGSGKNNMGDFVDYEEVK